MPLVGVALLLALSRLEPAPDLLNPLRGLEYYLHNPHDPLTDLTSTDWGSHDGNGGQGLLFLYH